MKIFGHSIDNAKSVQIICGDKWVEGQQLEFKREISETGEKRGSAIVKEVVALANHLGGYVIIGIDETNTKPPCAEKVLSIANCTDEANRLSRQLWDKIDPPIRGINCTPIVTEGDNSSGVIVIEVPSSLFGPHRSKFDKEVYQRNDEESRPLSMTEIHRLTLAFEKREDKIESRFVALREIGGEKFRARHGKLHMRVSAVPLADLDIDVSRCPAPWFKKLDIVAADGERNTTFAPKQDSERPVLRGKFREFSNEMQNMRSHWYQNGSFQLTHLVRQRDFAHPYAAFVLGIIYSALQSIDEVADWNGAPTIPYGLEFEIGCEGSTPILKLGAPDSGISNPHDGLFYVKNIEGTELLAPRVEYRAGDDKILLVNALWTDFWHHNGIEPPQIVNNIEAI